MSCCNSNYLTQYSRSTVYVGKSRKTDLCDTTDLSSVRGSFANPCKNITEAINIINTVYRLADPSSICN